jgi:hypothetical protein
MVLKRRTFTLNAVSFLLRPKGRATRPMLRRTGRRRRRKRPLLHRRKPQNRRDARV